MNRVIALFFCAWLCVIATSGYAYDADNEPIGLDEALDQFEEDSDDIGLDTGKSSQIHSETKARNKPVITPQTEESTFHWRGDIAFSMGYDFNQNPPEEGETDLRGLSKFRFETDLILDADLRENWRARAGIRAMYDMIFTINGRDGYHDEYLDASESELEIKELYISGSLFDDFDIKVGRQVVSWGTSETIRIVDIVNPLDQREPGQIDIEEMRLPVAMTRLDYYFNRWWSLTALLIHEWRGHKKSGFGSPYYPSDIQLPNNTISNFAAESHEIALALTGRFSGWDMTLNAARVFNDSGYLAVAPDGSLELDYERFNMIGATVQVASGNILYKGEIGLFDSLRFFNTTDYYKRFDAMLGIEYSGIKNTDITFEILNRHLIQFDKALAQSPDNTSRNVHQAVFRLSHDWANESWNAMLLSLIQWSPDNIGSLHRMELAHKWSDNIKLLAGLIMYDGDNGTYFEHINRSDRLFFSMKYSF